MAYQCTKSIFLIATPMVINIFTILIAFGTVVKADSHGGYSMKQSPIDVNEKAYCSFFNNRAPTPQPLLKNCSMFKENSCCLQQEIDATFGKVKPLQGSSRACQIHMNYLMCYICAPTQHMFYSRERLTVCEDFCDSLYDACKSAILKGSLISNLYDDGRSFCLSRSFEVAPPSSSRCFRYYNEKDKNSSRNISSDVTMICACLLLFLCAIDLQFYKQNDRSHITSKVQSHSCAIDSDSDLVKEGLSFLWLSKTAFGLPKVFPMFSLGATILFFQGVQPFGVHQKILKKSVYFSNFS